MKHALYIPVDHSKIPFQPRKCFTKHITILLQYTTFRGISFENGLAENDSLSQCGTWLITSIAESIATWSGISLTLFLLAMKSRKPSEIELCLLPQSVWELQTLWVPTSNLLWDIPELLIKINSESFNEIYKLLLALQRSNNLS